MTPRIPKNYIVQIDNFHLGEFIYYWNYYKQPGRPYRYQTGGRQ